MSTYLCSQCNTIKDSDFEVSVEKDGELLCEDCIEANEMLDLQKILSAASNDVSKMTSSEFILWLMEYSQAGGMTQVFIMCGLHAYAKASLEHDTCPKGDFINPEAWRRAAEHIVEMFDKRNSEEA